MVWSTSTDSQETPNNGVENDKEDEQDGQTGRGDCGDFNYA
jgi:hypothetical protein